MGRAHSPARDPARLMFGKGRFHNGIRESIVAYRSSTRKEWGVIRSSAVMASADVQARLQPHHHARTERRAPKARLVDDPFLRSRRGGRRDQYAGAPQGRRPSAGRTRSSTEEPSSNLNTDSGEAEIAGRKGAALNSRSLLRIARWQANIRRILIVVHG